MKKLLRKYKFAILSLFLLASANLAYLVKDFAGWTITLIFFLFVPGYLLLCLLRHSIKSRWEVISISLGLSLLILMLGGLALNGLHAFGLMRPLTTLNVFILLDVVTLGLLIPNRSKTFKLNIGSLVAAKTQMAVLAILSLLPLLAMCGAIRLNNGASNVLTVILFILIAVIFLLLVWKKELQPVYPYAVVMIGLAILFTISLRGSSITGHDIKREFYVFQLTFNAAYWNIAAFRDPYNACLSITILPTILDKITTIPSPYIFKVVFQMIYAFSLAPVYFFMKRLSTSVAALMGSFLFISFPTFLNDMPFINRQEVAFSFFGLLMLVSFMQMARRQKTVLTILFLLGLVLSHYSSSYIALGVLVLSAIFYKLVGGRRSAGSTSLLTLPLLSVPIILVALLITFLWNAQVTVTSSGLKDTLSRSVGDLFDHSAARADSASYSLLSPKTESPPQVLAKYVGNQSTQVQYANQPELPETKLGLAVSHLLSANTVNNVAREFSAKVLQALLLVGITVLFYRQRKNVHPKNAYFLALCFSCLVLLVLQAVLPEVSVDYGTLRFFQQALIILGIPIVVGAESLFFFLAPRLRIYVVAFVFAGLFLDLSGVIPQLLGSYPAQLSLNNSGEIYDLYYLQPGDLKAEAWLQARSDGAPVRMDSSGQVRFSSAIISGKIQPVAPFNVSGHTYFYQDRMNFTTNIYYADTGGDIIPYSISALPSADQLYVNQEARISY